MQSTQNKELTTPKVDIFLPGPVAVQKRMQFNGKTRRAFDPSERDKIAIRKLLCSIIPEPHPFAPTTATRIELHLTYPPIAKPRKDLAGLPRGDVDNVAKIYLDCMSKILFFDDRQVTQLLVTKKFGTASEQGIRILAYW